VLQSKVGRLIFNGFPTGVEVCAAMQHGGPYPATTDSRSTSVGTAAILRFARPIAYQNFPTHTLPPELQDANLRGIWRLLDGQWTKDPA
jgi:alpha-ketoglutaric semialdehyde dehydrogenase